MNTNLRYLLPGQPKLHVLAQLYAETRLESGWLELFSIKVDFYDGKTAPVGDFIDVDALVKYKDEGFASPVHRTTSRHPELLSIPGMAYFQDLFAFNCATGKLKERFADSHFNLNNDWTRIPHSCPMPEHQMRLIKVIWDVFDIYFTAANLVGERIETIRNPFCQDGLRQMLNILGRSSNHQVQSAEGWLLYDEIERMFDLEAKADARTIERASKIKPELEFSVPTWVAGQTMPAAAYRTDDKRLIRTLWHIHRHYGILVMRDRDGNYAIFTKGVQDLAALYTALTELEPELWEHEARYTSPFIGNGCESRPKPASKLTPSQVRDLIIKHVVYQTRGQAKA